MEDFHVYSDQHAKLHLICHVCSCFTLIIYRGLNLKKNEGYIYGNERKLSKGRDGLEFHLKM